MSHVEVETTVFYSSLSGKTRSMTTFFCHLLKDLLGKSDPGIIFSARVLPVSHFWKTVDSFVPPPPSADPSVRGSAPLPLPSQWV